jgi:hypothetical protein
MLRLAHVRAQAESGGSSGVGPAAAAVGPAVSRDTDAEAAAAAAAAEAASAAPSPTALYIQQHQQQPLAYLSGPGAAPVVPAAFASLLPMPSADTNPTPLLRAQQQRAFLQSNAHMHAAGQLP